MPLTIAIDDGSHNMDGLLLHAWDGSERVEAFIARRLMDSWVYPRVPMKVGGPAPLLFNGCRYMDVDMQFAVRPMERS